ncbi:Glycoprotein-N-acetylgalactosamine 3-beta-galactosyltransferase [Paragonimus heterotremus]|uniref:N-acetylgalactosaminide beta-1,3-galactosyltransferase n=1 Tax=Paragonimus heterotremus TaxID=100268 RepID=A0A8J4SX48_9TREM|nr:Glycoprotein-N-acetylgalactosamine 3-beta-galactosyltransferase [Paragonimus heterotremus]
MQSDRKLRMLANSLKLRQILCILFGFSVGCVFNKTIRQFTGWRLRDAAIPPTGIPMSLSPNTASINLASKSVTSIRILCMILTMPNNHALQARAVKHTWASRCDDYFFVSSLNDSHLPAYAAVSTENRNQLWDKTKFGVIYAATQYGRPFDYLFKADDDTYVIVENLRKMLEEHPKNQSVIMGRRFKPFVQQGYPSGGAGYVISRMGIDKIAHGMLTKKKCGIFAHTWTEDVRMGQCAQAVGVPMVDSLDAEGLERFHPVSAFDIFNWDENATSNWLTYYNYHKLLVGQRCCSNYSITFHYIKPSEMFTYDFLLYHIHTVFNKAEHDLSAN